MATTRAYCRLRFAARLARALRWLGVLAGAALIVALQSAPIAAELSASEPEVQAAFLYNFVRFVRWPDDVLNRAPAFPICILGHDPLESFLPAAVADKKVGDLPILVKEVDEDAKFSDCRILFISRSVQAHVAQVLDRVKGMSTLTVADIDAFVERGGVIRFRVEGNRMRLEVNVDAADAAQLKISSQLLKLARIVGSQSAPR